MSIATPINQKILKRDIKTSLIPSLLPLRLYSVGQRVYADRRYQQGTQTFLIQDTYTVKGWLWVDSSALVRCSEVPFDEAGYVYIISKGSSKDCVMLPESMLKPVK